MTNKTSPARDSKGRYIKKTVQQAATSVNPAAPITTVKPVMKNYIGISRDHSGSMFSIARAAAVDYNNTVKAIREASEAEKQDTIVSVVKCGVGQNGTTVRESVHSSLSNLLPLAEGGYTTDGGRTPLFNSVNELIDILLTAKDANDKNVSFVVMAITDGHDNVSGAYGAAQLSKRIQELQLTDRWTFIFRVPFGHKRALVQMGIPDGNILEWEQTTRGVEIATAATSAAFNSFYSARTRGATMTKSFYQTNLNEVSKATVKAKLVDISKDVQFFDVTSVAEIRPFIEGRINGTMAKGGAFYQLTKKEDEVQDYKQIAIRDKKSGHVYSGTEARNILGLPHNGTVKVAPGNHGAYDIFIQSTSVNRKLMVGTQVMYWPKVGVSYQS